MDKGKDREPGTGNRERETLADIAADIRDRAVVADRHGDRETSNESVAALLRDIANRIEAAARRDIKAAKDGVWHTADDIHDIHCRDCVARQSGNAAVMREALEDVVKYLGDILPTRREIELVKSARAALAAPARNCDVGTADEQAERFKAECKRHDHCTPCPVHAAWGEFGEGKPKSCQMIWAQMPYEAEKGGAE